MLTIFLWQSDTDRRHLRSNLPLSVTMRSELVWCDVTNLFCVTLSQQTWFPTEGKSTKVYDRQWDDIRLLIFSPTPTGCWCLLVFIGHFIDRGRSGATARQNLSLRWSPLLTFYWCIVSVDFGICPKRFSLQRISKMGSKCAPARAVLDLAVSRTIGTLLGSASRL